MLTVELLPATCVFSSLRTELSDNDWCLLEDKFCRGNDKECAACGFAGGKKPLKLFADWEFDDENHIQRLIGLVPLCLCCYNIRRIINYDDISNELIKHLARVNNLSLGRAKKYIESCLLKKEKRGQYLWKPDVSYLKKYFDIKLELYDIKLPDNKIKSKSKLHLIFSMQDFTVQRFWSLISIKKVFIIVSAFIGIVLLSFISPVIAKQLSRHPQHKSKCQPYSREDYINGEKVKVTGVACLRSDGKWYIRS